jgi:dipeptidyl aminopeptidase/acylaminoacyl peptidase
MSTPISPEYAVLEKVTIADAKLRPDGKAIAYVRVTVDKEKKQGVSHLWLYDIDGGNHRQITQSGTGNSDPSWSPDGSKLAYVTAREGDKPNAIAVMTFDGGEPELLVQHQQRPGDLQWSPDGESIAYSLSVDPDNPNETPRDTEAAPKVRVTRRKDYKQDGLGYIGDVRTQVMLLKVTSKSTKQLTSSPFHITRHRWSPDGATLVALTPYGGGLASRLVLIDVESGTMDAYDGGAQSIGLASWSPDGSKIFTFVEDTMVFHPDAAIFDVATKTFRKIGGELEFTATSFYAYPAPAVWLDDDRVLIPGQWHARSGLWTISSTSEEITQIALTQESTSGLSVSADTSTLVEVVDAIDGFHGIVVTDLATGERRRLRDEQEAFLAGASLAQWEEITVERNGFTIQGVIYKPADFDERKSYPVILDVHGGPQGVYDFGYNVFAQVAATNGFIVLLANPRGSTSFGKAFTTAGIQDWGHEDWADLQAILDVVCDKPYVDRDRSGIYGYSYGGYMTSWVLGHSTRFKAAVCGAPVFDLVSMWGSSDLGFNFLSHQIGGTPWSNPEAFKRLSPSTYIHNAVTPTLVVCGEADDRCPIGQSEELFISLAELGVETEFARYPGGAHPFIVTGPPEHRIDFLQRYLDWFKRFLGEPAA